MVDMRFKSDSGSNSDSDHTDQLVTAATDSSTRIGSKYRICNMIFALLVFLLTGTVIFMSWEKKQLTEQFAMIQQQRQPMEMEIEQPHIQMLKQELRVQEKPNQQNSTIQEPEQEKLEQGNSAHELEQGQSVEMKMEQPPIQALKQGKPNQQNSTIGVYPPYNVLLIGDSIDRNIVIALCEEYGERDEGTGKMKPLQAWGYDHIRYGDGTKQGTTLCQFGFEAAQKLGKNISVASMHVFGSSDGPYLFVQWNGMTSTKARIEKGLEIYSGGIEKGGAGRKLHRICFNSIVWDMRNQYVYGSEKPNSKEFNRTLSKFGRDTFEQLKHITENRRVKKKNVELVLRNAPYSNTIDEECVKLNPQNGCRPTGSLCEALNKAYLRIAKELSLKFLDFDAMVWDSIGGARYRYKMPMIYLEQRMNGSHPNWHQSLLGGLNLVGIREDPQYFRDAASVKGLPSFTKFPNETDEPIWKPWFQNEIPNNYTEMLREGYYR